MNRDCIFNKLTHYHVVGGLPPDVMHDLLEGVVPFIICKVISKALENGKKRNFNLESLNHCIRNFSYSHSEARDKPSVISDTHLKNGSLRQSSSQIWLLMTYLPIILLNEVPEIERTIIWQSFKDLTRICQIVFSDYIKNFDILGLRTLIHDFLCTLKNELGIRIVPKMHHLVHYPHYIERFGPLKNYWCMRFEAKHASFKTMARTTGNFINLPFTLAKRHQIWVIHQIGKSIDDYLTQEILMPEGTKVLLSSLSYANQLLQFLDSNSSTIFLSLSWIKVNTSHVCAKKTVLLCPTRGSLSYKFGLCCDIVKQKGTPKVCLLYASF